MTILVLGVVLLAVTLLLMTVAIFSGHIPVLCRLVGGEPLEKDASS